MSSGPPLGEHRAGTQGSSASTAGTGGHAARSGEESEGPDGEPRGRRRGAPAAEHPQPRHAGGRHRRPGRHAAPGAARVEVRQPDPHEVGDGAPAAADPHRPRHARSTARHPVARRPAVVEPVALEPVALDPVALDPPGGARSRHRRHRPQTLTRALRWTAASALLPGAGHLAAGRRRSGLLILTSFAGMLVAAGVLAVAAPRERLLAISVQPDSLRLVMAGCAGLGLVWVLLVLSTWSVTRPRGLTGGQRMIGAGVVTALSLVVATPFAYGGHLAYVQRDLIRHLFPDVPTPVLTAPDAPAAPAGTVAANPPFGASAHLLDGKPRLNVLLLGGDGGDNRVGVRTDTMILASIEVATGRTVLVSLPRNMERAPFLPDTPMAERFPGGFDQMLSGVYTYAEAHPEVMPGVRDPGGELLKQTIGYTLGQRIDHFVLVSLAGFKDIVDAFGGVTMTVPNRLAIGGRTDANGNTVTPPTGYLEAGRRKLNGHEALWFGRSRYGSDDYQRMGRQRCLLGAIARQASPLKVLTNFAELAGTAKRIIRTDIPQAALPELLTLAGKAKKAEVRSIGFVRSAQFRPEQPDFGYMQELVRNALRPPAAAAPPTAEPAGGSPAGGAASTSNAGSGHPAEDASSAVTLRDACGS